MRKGEDCEDDKWNISMLIMHVELLSEVLTNFRGSFGFFFVLVKYFNILDIFTPCVVYYIYLLLRLTVPN
jgi:hypothetical protein